MFALPPKAVREEKTPNSREKTNVSRVTPNILPCCIHHDGPVPVSRRYWNPIRDEGNDGKCLLIALCFFLYIAFCVWEVIWNVIP